MSREILLAFDVDGTLDTSAGPVAFAMLERWHYDGLHGGPIVAAVVSPSSAWPSQAHPEIPRFTTGGARRDNLMEAARAFPHAAVRLYVSDNQDAAEAEAAGFAYVDARSFSWGIRRLG